MSLQIQVIFYSMYGHVYRLAEAIADGARQVTGVEVGLFQRSEVRDRRSLRQFH
jgi:NAD(P)H dehydrogenase (quinone)